MLNNLFHFPVLTGAVPENAAQQQAFRTAIPIFIVLLVLTVAIAVVLEIMRMRSNGASERKIFRILSIPAYLLAVSVLVLVIISCNRLNSFGNPQINQPTESTNPSGSTQPSTAPSTEPTTVPTQPTVPPTEPTPTFAVKPHMVDKTNPANWNIKWETIADGNIVTSYQRPASIHFGAGDSYFQLPGISGFRGGNYRTSATYGTVNVTAKKLTPVWNRDIDALPKASSGAWTGAGWTGQPLIVEWDNETKSHMNLYPSAKAKNDLVEVIYATLDGNIYFYDLETGEYTRDPLTIGMAFKGSGALDPRGYPIMYVGSGDRTREGKQPRMFIINLLDCSVMYEYGHEKEFNFRSWRAFDASPLVHAATDTLIWPGENGLLYTIKLNSSYNKSAGTLSIHPDMPVMNRYMSDLNKDNYSNNLGMENSPIIVENYLYMGDNRGLFFCVDLNTMKLVWAQEIKDDLNATAVFDWGKDNKGYLYLATSVEYAKNTSYMYKLSAVTGEIIWEKSMGDVVYNKNVSGGALSSPLLGKKGTPYEGMIFFHIAKTPSEYEGTMLAMDAETGNILWQKTMKYCWSSPVAIYSEDGNAYLIIFDSVGNAHLMDGKTGNVLDMINIGSNVEASPSVFNDMLVVGTRGQKVYGIKIS
ncbi:MAG: pyrrolo-quinoline quinone [Ruminococcaceae bacterium]|nr:pyrrolo-quinoline quinone [Oscillospiraceae bacterium]